MSIFSLFALARALRAGQVTRLEAAERLEILAHRLRVASAGAAGSPRTEVDAARSAAESPSAPKIVPVLWLAPASWQSRES